MCLSCHLLWHEDIFSPQDMTLSALHNMHFQANQPASAECASKGKGLSRFEWVKQLGDGTFGSVHLYRTKDTHELVAIKM